MAYQTGTATSPSTLVDTIRSFALSLGWSVNYWGDDPQGTVNDDYWLSLATPGGNYFNLLADNSNSCVWLRGATGYTANANRNSQPGQSSGWSKNSRLAGPYAAYYLFGSATYIHVVVEMVTNSFTHFHIGVMEKSGDYTGGEYVSHTNLWDDNGYRNDPNTPYHTYPFDAGGWYQGDDHQCYRIDSDGVPNNWVYTSSRYGSGSSSLRANGFIRDASLVRRLFERSPNFITGQSILLPSVITGPRPLGNGSSIYGTIKDVRYVNIANITPKEVITIGTDQWMIFPVVRKGTGSIFEFVSGNYGIAYRKVT